MREATYQRDLIKRLERIFPNCHIMKNDPAVTQGIPDLLILWGTRWAMLEVKRSESEPFRPNQEYYLDKFSQMSFVAVIYPENEEDVLYDLQSAFGAVR